ncbi:MAG: extracellular solute-binding protein [Bacilli bacterium]|jgi:ABC-type glycerol-3-phosphate transport system substrate-binding protein|nr:extracellular solute-binding protein [Bacilli bacterium]
MKKKIKITAAQVKRVTLWTLLVLLFTLFIYVVVDSYGLDQVRSDSTIPESIIIKGEYLDYLDSYPNATTPSGVDIVVSGIDAVDTTFVDKDYDEIYGEDALYSTAVGYATWNVSVPTAGFYNILLDYIPEYEGGANIERRIYINGTVPFDDLNNITFQRVWGDGGDKIVDTTGNEIKPNQIEMPARRMSFVKDEVGYVTEPYLIYFNSGVNTIKLESLRESISIFALHVRSVVIYPTYEEVKADYETAGYQKVDGSISVLVEGEDSTVRSSSTIYAISDRTSAYNSPNDPVKIILNAIGGSKWSTPGDWINWEIDVPETGLYQISMRSKQSASRGLFSTRKVMIDGEVPFAEAQNAKFVYSSDWSMVTLGSEEEPYYFYLTAGKHTLTLEATLGDYGAQISRVQNVIDDLNLMYREIISKTGINPDEFVDYRLTEQIPNLIATFEHAVSELEGVEQAITQISGEKSSETASLETIMFQLRNFINKPRLIQRNIGSFSTNISALGTWILTVSRQSLVIDYIIVHSDDYALPKANPNFFLGSWYGIRSFVKSFFFDYQSIGNRPANEDADTVEVWLLTSESAGREQGNAIRTLIDSSYTGNQNINLKVVGPEVLLTATLAGRGPDIAINLWQGTPVNYALRGAIYDVSTFPDFEDVITQFSPSAMTPFEFNGGYYALPNTQSFLMLFYRTDIFQQKGWNVPATWEDVIDLIPELQIQNLQFYLPLNTVGASSVVNQIFASRLYQTGGTFYRDMQNTNNETYLESNFDSEEAMAAFEFWCEFYTSYSFSLTITGATFINRFRSGEMPIGIAGYDLYNTLAVSAPEIKGKWAFALLPGTDKGGGVIDHRGAASSTAVVMMKQTDVPDSAWEFMKWWVSTPTQVGYAREIEAILGSAARHPTANIDAFKQLAWTVDEQAMLLQQWDVTVGVPEVAGGYYMGRNLENAFREVVNNNYNPREILENYIQTIDAEITRKRKEFGLPVAD